MTRHNKAYWVGVFFTVTLAFFIWLTWKKLSEFIGNDTTAWLIAGLIVVVGVMLGRLKIDKIMKRLG